MKKYQLAIVCLLMTSSIFSQKTIYHEFEPTASDFEILKWNIDQNNLPKLYVKESIDEQGRVVELKFCENGKVMSGQLCYLDTWIKYQYPNDTTIISISLDSEGNFGGDLECENPFKVTYYLAKNKRLILRTNVEYYIGDTALYVRNGWNKEKLENFIESLESEHKTYSVIGGFNESFCKLSGIFPVSKDFVPQYFISNSPEGIEIEKALKE